MTRTKQRSKVSKKKIGEFRGQLLSWYDKHQRELPWRTGPGEKPEPYHVWLSEIMLQQTTVGAVGPYFTKFLDKWPDIRSLAAAEQEEVMSEWAGLGYYARARNLYACAQEVVGQGGVFPEDEAELKKLPGVGDYTSAAITSIAFDKPAVVVDGNVERIMARYFAVKDPLPKSKPVLKELAAPFFEGFEERPGDLAQAFMDLGATICIPKNPRCGSCPVSEHCQGRIKDLQSKLPRKKKEKYKPQKFGYVYWIENEEGHVLLHRRPEKGMLGGMIGLPTSDWVERKHKEKLSGMQAKDYGASIYHSFTHFDLELRLKSTVSNDLISYEYYWQELDHLNPSSFPTLFKKAVNIFHQS